AAGEGEQCVHVINGKSGGLSSCCLVQFGRVQGGASGQALHVAPALHRLTADPVATGGCLGDTEVFQERADHADRKAIARTDRVDDLGHRHAGHERFVELGA
nr:hypothetical protein [Tanacetum cinerariifolium]